MLLTRQTLFDPAFSFAEQDQASTFTGRWRQCWWRERSETLRSLNPSSLIGWLNGLSILLCFLGRCSEDEDSRQLWWVFLRAGCCQGFRVRDPLLDMALCTSLLALLHLHFLVSPVRPLDWKNPGSTSTRKCHDAVICVLWWVDACSLGLININWGKQVKLV